MTFLERYAHWFRRILPSPFMIAIVLTLITLLAAILYGKTSTEDLLLNWKDGLWNSSMLTFAFQMMFMLVLGHALALSSPITKLIDKLIKPLDTTAKAAFIIVLSTLLLGYINWGLALIFGAIMARKIGESFQKRKLKLNYPLIGAGAYVGLMIWHGGLSGSAPVKAAESGHLQTLAGDQNLPEAISLSETIFSPMNICAFFLIILILPVTMYLLGKRNPQQNLELSFDRQTDHLKNNPDMQNSKRLKWVGKISGLFILSLAVYTALIYKGNFLGFINPDYINFVLLGLGLTFHSGLSSFLTAVENATGGAAGILLQFPLYFGILALMDSGGLIELGSSFFISISNEYTFPLFTFISAGLVNIFVPSGGGQWAIQGPIIIDAAQNIGVPLHKCIMAMAYGDQLTNMMQPFWALPLLSITGLKARDILPYTLILMFAGFIIFTSVLFIF